MSVTLTLTESKQLMKDGFADNGSSEVAGDKVGGKQDGNEEEEDAREAELIVFDNTTQGLGLKICGGCNANEKEDYGIFVKRVLPGGLADTSGDVYDGDLILEVNGQSMQGVSYERAVTMLRQASASNHVELVITRDADARREFAEYLANYGTIQSPQTVPEIGFGAEQVTDSDTEFQRKMGAFFKDSDPFSFENQHNLYTGKYSDVNGHISPASSCASEVANHIGDAPHSPYPVRPQSNSKAVLRSKNTPSDYLDSLLSKKLSQDPGLKLHVDQLESAIASLGLLLNPSSQAALRQNLNIDPDGMVRFEDFVEAAKDVFHNELGALRGRLTPQVPYENILQPSVNRIENDYASVVKERDELRTELAALKEELRNHDQSSHSTEEQLLFIRKQAQASIEEGRSLRSKLHLAEQAQVKAQQTERDYEEVVAMLENEVAQLRLQLSKSDGVNMQKRLAVLVCQLKKTESGKKTCEVATEKLMRYVEHTLEVLASLENSPRITVGTDSANAKQNKKKTLQSLANEGREVIKVVRSLMETVPLPFGWEEAYTAEGIKYYINHLNQTTTWTHPVSCMEHQTSAKTQAVPAQGQQKQQQQQQPPNQQKQPPNQQKQQQIPAYQQIQPQQQKNRSQLQVPPQSPRPKKQQEEEQNVQETGTQQKQQNKEARQWKNKNNPQASRELQQAQVAS